MNKDIIRLVTFLLFGFSSSSIASSLGPKQGLEFDLISTKDGLSQVVVLSILQDRQGFLWFGTMDGLNKFDGHHFSVYKNNPNDAKSLSNNRINTILEDSQDFLWIGTDNGLNRFDRNTNVFTSYKHNPADSNSIQSNFIQCVYEDTNQDLWIGTQTGLSRFNPSSKSFYHIRTLQQVSIQTISDGTGDRILIGTDQGLFRLKLSEPNKIEPLFSTEIGRKSVHSILTDTSNDIWIGLENGLMCYDSEHKSIKTYKTKIEKSVPDLNFIINSIQQLSDGQIWVGTDFGLYIYDRSSDNFIFNEKQKTPSSSIISNSNIYRIFEDQSAMVWLGTYGGGLKKYNRYKSRIFSITNNSDSPFQLSHSFVYTICEDQQNDLWVGTDDGLNRYLHNSHKMNTFKHKQGNPSSIINNRIRHVYEDSDGIIWIGTYGGLSRFDRNSNSFDNFLQSEIDSEKAQANIVLRIFEDNKKHLWVLSIAEGLLRFDRKNNRFIRHTVEKPGADGIEFDRFYSVCVDDRGSFWLGTYGEGLVNYDPVTKESKQFLSDPKDRFSLSSDFIYSIYQDKTGSLWIGTYGAGVCRLESESGKFSRISKQSGLPNDVVYGILEDDNGYLWFSTNSGLAQFKYTAYQPYKENYSTLFRYFDMNDGLQDNEFNFGAYFKSHSGEMFFGGVNGFSAFHPDSLLENRFVPPVVFTEFVVNNQPIIPYIYGSKSKNPSRLRDLKFPYWENSIAFEFAALDFSNVNKIRYAYMLEGVDTDWIYTNYQRRYANYSNLRGGDYRLRIRATNSDGVWNNQGLSLKFHIQPPFWEQLWFYMLALFALISFALVLHRSRTRTIKIRNKQLNDINFSLKKEVIERRLAEQALAESEEKYATIFNSAPVGIFHFNRNGIITDCNDRFVTIIGSTKDILIGFNLLKDLHDQKLLSALRKCLDAGGGFYDGTYTSLTSDKATPLQILLNATYSSDEQIIGGVGIVEDVTERKRAEVVQQFMFNLAQAVNRTQSIHEFYSALQEELSRLIDTTNFFIGLYDQESDTISLPLMKDQKDRFEQAPAKDTISKLVIQSNQAMLLNEEQMDQLEKDGLIGHVGSACKIWLGVPLRLEDKVIGLIVVQNYHDENAYTSEHLSILEFVSNQLAVSIMRKQAEDEIDKLRQSLEQSSASLLIADINGAVEYCNPKLLEITGYSIVELKHNDIFELISENKKENIPAIWKNIHRGKEWYGEIEASRKDGSEYWAFISISPIRDEEDKVTHFVLVLEDITEMRTLRDQLTQAQRMESIGTLAGGIAHDFNNLLTVINGHAEIALMKSPAKDSLAKDITAILEAGQRAASLTRQLLAFSRKQIYKTEIVDINSVISGLDNMLRRLIGEDIHVETMFIDNVPKINADPSQLEQVLMNLIINARDAINDRTELADEKKITIETAVSQVSETEARQKTGLEPGTFVCFSISDTGLGMAEEVKSKIFEPFFTTKEIGRGTGLGLATVYGIVKQNKGGIYVYSEPGHGTTIKIYWPVSEDTEPPAEDIQESASLKRGSESILLVEDDNNVRAFARDALNVSGYTIYESENGKDALDLIIKNNLNIQMVITDLIMPEMNGKEFAEKIEQMNSSIKILFTSGYSGNHMLHNGILAEDINFLHKPYTLKSLSEKVRKVLDS